MADTKSSDDTNKVETEGTDVPNRPDGENPTNEVAKLTGSLLQNPEVMAAFEQKLAGMVGRKSGYIDSLPKSIKRRLKALKRLQSDYHNTESKFYEELHALECKYEELQKPILEKRRAIVTASKEPTDSECDWSSDDDEEEHGENEKAKVAEIDETNKNKEKAENEKETIFSEDTKGIPEFWLTIFKNVESLAFMVQEHDEPILKNLLDIHVKLTSDGKMGFLLEFLFAPNEYFENSVLTKEYIMRCGPDPKEPLSYEGPQIVKCTGCKVDWKKGKNVTVKNVKQKQKGKGGQKKMVTKTVKCDSFFNFFSPPEVKDDDDEEEEEEDEETQALLMQDFEIGQTLQQNIIPKAVLYFTGEALEATDEDDDDYEYGEEGDDEDYNEDDDPEYKPKEGKDQPSECKQQ